MSDDLTPAEVRESLQDWFGTHSGLPTSRAMQDGEAGTDPLAGFDRQQWQELAEQVGFAAMAISEELGGLELGLAHLLVASEQSAMALVAGPARASFLAGLLASRITDAPEWLGEILAAVAAGEAVAGIAALHSPTEVQFDPAGQVSGRLSRVSHGAVADLTLVPVVVADQPRFVLVNTAEKSVSELPSTDATLPFAHQDVTAAPAVLLPTTSSEVLTLAHLLLASELIGVSEAVLAQVVDYAKVREQFGAVIGTYQAIQHRCANVAIDIVASRALVTAAADALLSGSADSAHQLALLARAAAGRCAIRAVNAQGPLNGGIGFTWEHDAHLYFRRARVLAHLDGTPDFFDHQAVAAGSLDLLVSAV